MRTRGLATSRWELPAALHGLRIQFSLAALVLLISVALQVRSGAVLLYSGRPARERLRG